MSMPALSIYIPVHNGERHLGRLLATLAPLPAARVEVVVVDDASTDHTLEIARDFASRRPGTQVLARPANGGPGPACGDGVAAARGQWIQRVDADDEAMPSGLMGALNRAEAGGVDIVFQPWMEERPDGTCAKRERRPGRQGGYWIEWTPATWALMVRADYLRERGVSWPLIPYGEDAIWLWRLCAGLPLARAAFVDEPSIVYRYNQGSLSRSARHDQRLWLPFIAEMGRCLADLESQGHIGGQDRILLDMRVRGVWLDRLCWQAGKWPEAWREFLALPPGYRRSPRYWRLLKRLLLPPWLRRPSRSWRERGG